MEKITTAARLAEVSERLEDEKKLANDLAKHQEALNDRLELRKKERELATQEEINKRQLDYIDAAAKAKDEIDAKLRKRIQIAELTNDQKQLKKLQDYKDKLEQKSLKNLDKIAKEKIAAEMKEKIAAEMKARDKAERERAAKEAKDEAKSAFAKGKTVQERREALKNAFTNETGERDLKKGLAMMTSLISDFAKELNGTIESIAKRKGEIDTRLQGSQRDTGGMFGMGSSYWDNIQRRITGAAGVSPLVKQEDVTAKLSSMVSRGIASNIEQRAFLDVLKDRIATTFEATNGTLLRLVRIQQRDSTAARLGMESALTAFLNNMYETTEYMTDAMSSIKSSLEEAEALMGTKSAAAFEYQVQKWMGSMYSVGMSQSGVQSIANALGQIAAGDISGLTSSGAGNLVIMAANGAGLSVADMLNKGLTDEETNALLAQMAEYLRGIYDGTKDSKVISQQYASVFGLRASDLKAISNLRTVDVENVQKNLLSYDGMIQRLQDMANTMWLRMSAGELMSNTFGNLKYSLASGIASNPALYAAYNIASMLDSTVGGIAIPAFSVMGTGFDLETTVADIMRVGAIGGGILSGLGALIDSASATGSAGGLTGSSLLNAIGISGSPSAVRRGSGQNLPVSSSGEGLSDSGMIGNGNGDDIQKASLGGSQDDANKQLVEKQDEDSEIKLRDVDEHVVAIYSLLEDVVSGTRRMHVSIGGDYAWPN